MIETMGPGETAWVTGASDGSAGDREHAVAVRYRLGADVDGHRIDIPGVMWFGVHDGLHHASNRHVGLADVLPPDRSGTTARRLSAGARRPMVDAVACFGRSPLA